MDLDEVERKDKKKDKKKRKVEQPADGTEEVADDAAVQGQPCLRVSHALSRMLLLPSQHAQPVVLEL